MTGRIVDLSVPCATGGVDGVEKASIAPYGSLDFGSSVFLQGCKVCEANFNFATAMLGIGKKKEPRSPHNIIFDLMEGRL